MTTTTISSAERLTTSMAFVKVDYVWEHPMFPEHPRTTSVLVPSPLPTSDDDFPEWTISGKEAMEHEYDQGGLEGDESDSPRKDGVHAISPLASDDVNDLVTKNIILKPSAIMRESDGRVVALCETEFVRC